MRLDRGLFVVAAALACAVTAPACSKPREPVAPPPAGRSSATWGEHGSGKPGPLVGDYTVTWTRDSGALAVEARLTAEAGGTFRVDRGAERFVRDAAAAPDRDGAPFVPMSHGEAGFEAVACAKGPCRIRYRFLLNEAARRLDDLDSASDEGDVVEITPATFMLVPAAERDLRVRFRVNVPSGMRFVTGVFPSTEAKGAWDISLDDLWSSPYSAFGAFRTHEVATNGATIELALGPGKLTATDDELVAWTSNAARAVATYYGRFPMHRALVLVVVASGRWVGGGRTLAGGGGTVFMRLGDEARKKELDEDWVLVHELTHLTIPSLPPFQTWAEEGIATYVEPFARVRAGLLSESAAWSGLLDGLPNGLPDAGDKGLDHTPTWGRTYWGGALFWLLADVGIRKATENRYGLEHAMRGIQDHGGINSTRWSFDDTCAEGDRATGTHVLRDLYASMGASPHPVDLAALAKSLGVESTRRGARFDDKAPLAAIRKAITYGNPPSSTLQKP